MRTGEGVDEVTDRVLAHRAAVAGVGDQHAQSRQDQHARQQQHGAELALGQPVRLGVEARLVGGHQPVRRLGVDCVQEQMGQQPVDLCRGAADRVAEAGLHHPRRRRGQYAKVEEHARRCMGRQAELEAVPGDRDRRGDIAVHRRRGGEHRAAAVGAMGDVLAEIIEGARADGDQGVDVAAALLQQIGRRLVGLGTVENDRLGIRQRRRDAGAEDRPGVLVGDHGHPRDRGRGRRAAPPRHLSRLSAIAILRIVVRSGPPSSGAG